LAFEKVSPFAKVKPLNPTIFHSPNLQVWDWWNLQS